MDWNTAAVFVAGVAVGALVMYLLRHKLLDGEGLQRKLAEAETDAEAYRAQVDEHFERTADLFQEVTEKYRTLHDHLAQGATGLARGAKRLPPIELPEKMLPETLEDAVAVPPRTPEAGVDINLDERPGQADTAHVAGAQEAPAGQRTADAGDAARVADAAKVAETAEDVRR